MEKKTEQKSHKGNGQEQRARHRTYQPNECNKLFFFSVSLPGGSQMNGDVWRELLPVGLWKFREKKSLIVGTKPNVATS